MGYRCDKCGIGIGWQQHECGKGLCQGCVADLKAALATKDTQIANLEDAVKEALPYVEKVLGKEHGLVRALRTALDDKPEAKEAKHGTDR